MEVRGRDQTKSNAKRQTLIRLTTLIVQPVLDSRSCTIGCSSEEKPQGRELTDDRKANNNNRMRATIERVIANIKTWRILNTDKCRLRKTFQTTLDAVRGLIVFRQSTPCE